MKRRALLPLLPLLLAPTSAWAAPKSVVALDSGWQVRIDPADAAAARAHPKETRWLAATVPGSVQQDLIAARRVPDPFKGTDEAAIQWVGLTDWQYRRVLDVTPAMLARGHLDLVFDGLDTFATVLVNGRPLLDADNAHRRWRADARPLLHVGRNAITVAIASPIRRLQPMVLAQAHPLPANMTARSATSPRAGRPRPISASPNTNMAGTGGPASSPRASGARSGSRRGTMRGSTRCGSNRTRSPIRRRG